ncbi:pyridoxamine 5'-phosphate oxidase family protein [Actinoplanes utahensis]
MTTGIIPEEHRDLLERPLIADLATVREDGTPQVNPMWFAWDGEFLSRCAPTSSAWRTRTARAPDPAPLAVRVAALTPCSGTGHAPSRASRRPRQASPHAHRAGAAHACPSRSPPAGSHCCLGRCEAARTTSRTEPEPIRSAPGSAVPLPTGRVHHTRVGLRRPAKAAAAPRRAADGPVGESGLLRPVAADRRTTGRPSRGRAAAGRGR